jgi:hypothetical protein
MTAPIPISHLLPNTRFKLITGDTKGSNWVSPVAGNWRTSNTSLKQPSAPNPNSYFQNEFEREKDEPDGLEMGGKDEVFDGEAASF